MKSAASADSPEPSPDGPSSDRRAQAIFAAIEALIDGLSPSEREMIRRKITNKLRPIPVPQAGDVLGMVVQLIPRDRQFTVAELKEAIEREFATIPAKKVHDAVGYLAREKHIRRIGYGRYMIGNIPIVSADDFGGVRSITEEDGDD